MRYPSYFNIYNASAGTGKTFNLVKDYLVLIIRSNNILLFKKILVITFTNKAVNEMKSRIMKYLTAYANSNELDNIMLEIIMNETGLTKSEVFSKSLNILKKMIKNYSDFEISTIDKFTQKIIRNFTYELGINSKYEVQIDQDEILKKSVDNLISKMRENDEVSMNILNFSFDKTVNDKSWDVTSDLEEISKLILNENNFYELEQIEELKINDFNEIKKKLKETIYKNKSECKILSKKFLELIKIKKISSKSFVREMIPKHFEKIYKGNFDRLYENKIEQNLLEDKYYLKNTCETELEKIKSIKKDILDIYRSCKKKILKIKITENVCNNLYPLSILKSIKKEIENLKQEENFIIISEFNKIVSKEISNQPAPFIYEKIGNKFLHYFIDEFQDTSKLQWANLKPLIENTLASENSSLTISGDPKQSIYKWRGGDYKQLIELINKNIFFSKPNIYDLNTNFRSSKEIVNFNNTLFLNITKILKKNNDISNIFNFPKQKSYSKKTGYISLDFFDKKNNTRNDFNGQQIKKNIQDILKRGYRYNDICILVRKKKEGKIIADFLNDANIPIISSEVLNINTSIEVKFIINLFEFIISESHSSKMDLCKSLCELNFIDLEQEDFLIEAVDKDFEIIKEYINIKGFDININKIRGASIYESIEYIIYSFGLIKKGNSYLQFFLDYVLDILNKTSPSINQFLDDYHKVCHKLNITNPQNINAVEILTIHKSKGLEFPIVIVPFADINLHQNLKSKIWVDFNNELEIGLKKSLINVNKDLLGYDEKIYNNFKWGLEIENLNLLYVALTRAKEEMYIISEKNLDSCGKEKINYFSGIFINYLKNLNLWEKSKNKYEFGLKNNNTILEKSSKNVELNEFIVNSMKTKNILLNTKKSDSWINDNDVNKLKGNIFHLIMSKIKSAKQLETTLDNFFQTGQINLEEKTLFKKNILKIFNDPKIGRFFDDKLISFNEREILCKNCKNIIPDRITFLDNNSVVIIDYKTGIERASHIKQMLNYESTLNSMGLKVVDKILIYISNEISIKCDF